MRTKSLLVLLLFAGAFRPAPVSVPVRGHLHRLAQPRFDRGQVADLFQLNHVTIMFKPTAGQQSQLNSLLDQQQDPSSPNYHQWITPEEFGDRFGLNSAEFDNITVWLQANGFTIDETPSSRNWIAFTGNARQMRDAFKMRIHEYLVNGESHFAASNEPLVPAEFANSVLGFRSIHNFRAKSRMVKGRFTSSLSGAHFLAPDDWATIYDAKPLYNSNITGAGQKIAVLGQSDIQLQDIRSFRSNSGLPASDPQIILVPGSPDPGVVSGDVDEASLDIEWSGAVARGATIVYVNSNDVVGMSLPYAVSQNLAPVISLSYGDCEPNWTAADQASLTAIAQQANAQGITISVASGDAGAADCDGDVSGRFYARDGLTVDLPAALPYVTALGGTEFNEPGNQWSEGQSFGNFFGKGSATYWSPSNNGSNGSALSYIPEVAWNDTLFDGALAASGGGKSTLFPKPAWQAAPGVPNDSARDVPDVSFSASADIDPYLICSTDTSSSTGPCVNGFRDSNGYLNVIGGTSVAAPSFAGVVALINQMTNSRQGNVNPTLYRIASNTRVVFHDILQSGNQAPCIAGTADCAASGFLGYTSASGYDLATGLGTIDVLRLLQTWVPNQP